MVIKDVKITDLKEYENNPRFNKSAVDPVAASIREFGFKVPLVIDKDNVIVAGHTRLKVAKKLGLETVPCVIADDLTDEQIKAFRIADNKTAEISEWNFDKLETELAQLAEQGFNMGDYGFDDFEVDHSEIPEDDVPDVDEKVESVVKLGQLWKLGDHRLLCGDSTSSEDVARLMAGQTAKILFTSPPYSDMREYNGDKDLSVNNLIHFISTYAPYTNYQCVNLGIQRKDNEIVPYWDAYIDEAKKAGLKLMAWNVWDKQQAGSIGQQRAFFPIRHEWIFVFGTEYFDLNCTWEKAEDSIGNSKIRKVRQPDGSFDLSSRGNTTKKYKKMESVLAVHAELGAIRSEHPATFPVQLPAEYINAMTNKDDNVIEPFCGSGSTLIACEQLGRHCFGMELDPHYCDVIIKRWETLTGGKAELINE